MGREVRMVPKDWQHPKNKEGRYIPLLNGSFSEYLKNWNEGKTKWDQGLRDDFNGGYQPKEKEQSNMSYEEWEGQKPVPEDYMPDWPVSERTHLQMYEDCTEGTPISPVMETPEELARWLSDNGASAFGHQTATYEQWLCTIKQGWAPSMVMSKGEIKSGVASSCKKDEGPL